MATATKAATKTAKCVPGLYEGLRDPKGKRLLSDYLYTGELELLGTWEVHRYLGIEKSRVARWLVENDEGKAAIEEPVARLKSGPFWTLAQIRRKAEQMYLAESRDVTAAPGVSDETLDAWLESRRARRPSLVSA